MFILRIIIISTVCFLATVTAAETYSIPHIKSVTEINHVFGPHTVLVCDADETIAQVNCMPLNYENGRQHGQAIMKVAISFYESLGKKYDAANIDDISAIETFASSVDQVFESVPISYNLTEEAWSHFLESARKSGAQTIIVSSRRFKKEEPARIEFFESLGFKEDQLLYARKAKDIRLHEWLTDKPEITDIVFVDNLHAHCIEVAQSSLLEKYNCTTFVHNAYLEYFNQHHQTILPIQLHAAHNNKQRLTDKEALQTILK